MKLKAIRLYQAIPIGQYTETYLMVGQDKHPGLEMEWLNGLVKIKSLREPDPIYVPPANIMFFRPLLEEAKPVKGPKA